MQHLKREAMTLANAVMQRRAAGVETIAINDLMPLLTVALATPEESGPPLVFTKAEVAHHLKCSAEWLDSRIRSGQWRPGVHFFRGPKGVTFSSDHLKRIFDLA